MKVGVLAIQGSVEEHVQMLKSLDVEVKEVKCADDLEGLSGIILPGGESTAQSRLLKRFGLFEVLQNKIQNGFPVWGTCAGSILLAKNVTGKIIPETFQAMNITVERNAYGAQRDSFIVDIEIQFSSETKKIEAVFIRAPKIKKTSNSVQVLAMQGENEVMLREGNMLVTSFHPELTEDTTVHEYFLEMCKGSNQL